jgi:hypothetical protein
MQYLHCFMVKDSLIVWDLLASAIKHMARMIFFPLLGCGETWVHLVRRPVFGLLYQPWMIDDECGAVSGMRIGKGNRSTRRKSAPVLFCPKQMPHVLNWDRKGAAAVGSQRLTAWAMARPLGCYDALSTLFGAGVCCFIDNSCWLFNFLSIQ